MHCLVGDYIVDKNGLIFHVTSKNDKSVLNVRKIPERMATEEEVERYHEGYIFVEVMT